MWIMTSFGIIMPSERPAKHTPKGDPKTLQIRARRKKDLEILRDEYMPTPGMLSEIEHTPTMDYNYRVYARPEDFAAAVGKMVMDIDYTKFKPTTESKYKDRALHDVYNSIWGTVTRLGKPWEGRPLYSGAYSRTGGAYRPKKGSDRYYYYEPATGVLKSAKDSAEVFLDDELVPDNSYTVASSSTKLSGYGTGGSSYYADDDAGDYYLGRGSRWSEPSVKRSIHDIPLSETEGEDLDHYDLGYRSAGSELSYVGGGYVERLVDELGLELDESSSEFQGTPDDWSARDLFESRQWSRLSMEERQAAVDAMVDMEHADGSAPRLTKAQKRRLRRKARARHSR